MILELDKGDDGFWTARVRLLDIEARRTDADLARTEALTMAADAIATSDRARTLVAELEADTLVTVINGVPGQPVPWSPSERSEAGEAGGATEPAPAPAKGAAGWVSMFVQRVTVTVLECAAIACEGPWALLTGKEIADRLQGFKGRHPQPHEMRRALLGKALAAGQGDFASGSPWSVLAAGVRAYVRGEDVTAEQLAAVQRAISAQGKE